MLRLQQDINDTPMRVLEASVGALFLIAGIGKLRSVKGFTEVVEQHSWATRWFPAKVSSITVVGCEVSLGAGLIGGIASRDVALASIALLTLFTMIVTISLNSGKHPAKCGCMVPMGGDELNWTIYPRNVGLGLWLVPSVLGRGTFVFGVIGAAFLLLSVVLANRERARPQVS